MRRDESGGRAAGKVKAGKGREWKEGRKEAHGEAGHTESREYEQPSVEE